MKILNFHVYKKWNLSYLLLVKKGESNFLIKLCLFQLPQVEANGQEPIGRRFRVENGDSLGEKDEVGIIIK